MSDYFVIRNSDGNTTVRHITEEQLIKALDEEYWGKVEYLSKMPNSIDTNYWGNSVLIIQGNIAVPQAEEVIIKHRIGKVK